MSDAMGEEDGTGSSFRTFFRYRIAGGSGRIYFFLLVIRASDLLNLPRLQQENRQSVSFHVPSLGFVIRDLQHVGRVYRAFLGSAV